MEWSATCSLKTRENYWNSVGIAMSTFSLAVAHLISSQTQANPLPRKKRILEIRSSRSFSTEEISLAKTSIMPLGTLSSKICLLISHRRRCSSTSIKKSKKLISKVNSRRKLLLWWVTNTDTDTDTDTLPAAINRQKVRQLPKEDRDSHICPEECPKRQQGVNLSSWCSTQALRSLSRISRHLTKKAWRRKTLMRSKGWARIATWKRAWSGGKAWNKRPIGKIGRIKSCFQIQMNIN